MVEKGLDNIDCSIPMNEVMKKYLIEDRLQRAHLLITKHTASRPCLPPNSGERP
jgi:hypothetical protein